jgi:TolA-binding protein
MQQNKTNIMKTAMQELIDLMKSHEARGWGNMTFDFFFAQLDEIKALEKEKEQIIDAANQKIFGDITFTGSDEVITKGENYYNQTYNQKIPELLYKDGTSMRKVKLSKEAQELLDEATKRFNQNK